MENKDEINNTPINHTLASAALINKYHFDQLPPVGGMPMMHKLPTKNAPIVQGIFLPIPAMSEISVLCTRTIKAPAAKNRVI